MLTLTLLVSLVTQFDADAERERIRSHLELVEQLLRSAPTPDATTRAARDKNLDALHAYWQRRQYPRNTTVPFGRNPIFIDEHGVACAAGALIIESGARSLAERISLEMNEQYLDEMHDAELDAWVAQSGLTSGELRLIQPTYSYHPASSDPLLEAAHLGNTSKVKSLLSQKRDPVQLKSATNEALRAAVTSAREGRFAAQEAAKKRTESVLVSYETRWASDGLGTIDDLLAAGGDPNQLEGRAASLLFLAQDRPEVRSRLIKARARFTPSEVVVMALKAGDCAKAAAAFRDPGVDFTLQDFEMTPGGFYDPRYAAENRCGAELDVAQDLSAPKNAVVAVKHGAHLNTLAKLRSAFDQWRIERKGTSAAAKDGARSLNFAIGQASGLQSKRPYSVRGLPPCEPEAVEALSKGDAELIELYGKHLELQFCAEFNVRFYLFKRKRRLTPGELEHVDLLLHGRPLLESPAVYDAVENRDVLLAEVLIKHHSPVNSPNMTDGSCPAIARAAATNQLAMVKVLKRAGASIAMTFVPSPNCPGLPHPERPRPVNAPKRASPSPQVGGPGQLVVATGSSGVISAGAPSGALPGRSNTLITLADMNLSTEMRAALGLR